MGGKGSAAPPTQAAPAFDASMFAMPEMHMPESSGPSASEIAAQNAAAEEERRKNEGLANRDSLYSDRTSAAGSATDYINKQITDERSNAQLMGVDYNITDDQKSARINDYFGSIWGAGDEDTLGNLMKEWGNPEGHEEFSITRGDGSTLEGTEGSEETVSESGGITKSGKKGTVLTEDEDSLGGKTTILGA